MLFGADTANDPNLQIFISQFTNRLEEDLVSLAFDEKCHNQNDKFIGGSIFLQIDR